MVDQIDSFSVSSVLNKDVKQFGKKYMFDNNDETCWNSDQGTPQWVNIKFKEECCVASFTIQFQGGFSGKDCVFKGELFNGGYEEMPFYPEDNNTLQTFKLNNSNKLKSMCLLFNNSYDFFGRIVIYRIALGMGHELR